ncbi:hypothetical protein [Cytobacillus sp. IB215665]|uniref:hypothetical protein n=1 Tax=Cytobacillus sp. IB215665 TaxID=3097357 RepID=UPI002A1475DE|nr:hypothetical protein [Cytobacillus sp. IB215665]MDX8367697.1 hypothetical protein [Cytobacillus sp. IB215665]
MIMQELDLYSSDWGFANLNPMVRAFGLKRDRKAKCKSCLYLIKEHGETRCIYRTPVEHDPELRACSRYLNRKKQREWINNEDS